MDDDSSIIRCFELLNKAKYYKVSDTDTADQKIDKWASLYQLQYDYAEGNKSVMSVDEFIKKHTHYRYCEAISWKGNIIYAIPDHKIALYVAASISANCTIRDIVAEAYKYPLDEAEFLLQKINGIEIRYDYVRGFVTKQNQQVIDELYKHALINTNIIHQMKGVINE